MIRCLYTVPCVHLPRSNPLLPSIGLPLPSTIPPSPTSGNHRAVVCVCECVCERVPPLLLFQVENQPTPRSCTAREGWGAAGLPMVQCSPFQPWLHSHLPSLQVPCSAQRGWQALWLHAGPVQPSSQRQVPPMHTPCEPQSTEHISALRKRAGAGEKSSREWEGAQILRATPETPVCEGARHNHQKEIPSIYILNKFQWLLLRIFKLEAHFLKFII